MNKQINDCNSFTILLSTSHATLGCKRFGFAQFAQDPKPEPTFGFDGFWKPNPIGLFLCRFRSHHHHPRR